MKLMAAAFAALLMINFMLWIFLLPRIVRRSLGRFQNDLINRHYDEVETMYRKMRGWRHDYHNHIQTLKAYMEMERYGEAEDYLDMLDRDLTTIDTVLKTGNVMMDAILNSKLALIREKQIHVDATAIVPGDIPIPGVDLSVIIGNLLDNAMEACMKLPPQERFIRIYIDILKKQLYVSVTNSMQGNARRADGRFVSGKAGGHGFGLLRIDSIVEKHYGYVNRQCEDGVFATEVLLPLI